MALRQLAREIVLTSRRGRRTPVLVTPPYLELREPFYVALALEIVGLGPREIFIDWQQRNGWRGYLGTGFDKRRASRISRGLAAALSDRDAVAVIEVTAAIARPDAARPGVTLGVCDSRAELPTYAAAIHFAASPFHSLPLQSAA